MKTSVKDLAQFIAAAIWADGEFGDEEKDMLKEVESALNLPAKDVEKIVKDYDSLSEEQVSDALAAAAKNVDAKEKGSVLDIVLQFIISDGVVTAEEMSNYYAIASILGVSSEDADALFDQTVEEYDDLVIEDAE